MPRYAWSWEASWEGEKGFRGIRHNSTNIRLTCVIFPAWSVTRMPSAVASSVAWRPCQRVRHASSTRRRSTIPRL